MVQNIQVLVKNILKSLTLIFLLSFSSRALALEKKFKEQCQRLFRTIPRVLDFHSKKHPVELSPHHQFLKEHAHETNGRMFQKALVPDAPAIVLYNWAAYDENFLNLTTGIHPTHLQGLIERSTPAHLGLYLASDPVTCAKFGSVLMEVAIYKSKMPLRDGKLIRWIPVTSHQIADDLTAGSGGGLPVARQLGMQVNHFVVKDLRVIKEVRWPNFEMIKGFWVAASFESEESIDNEHEFKIAEQWLVNPNISLRDRVTIFKKDPEKFFRYISNRGDFQFYASNNDEYRTGPDTEAVILNSILQILGLTDRQIIATENGVADLAELSRALKKASAAHQHELRKLIRPYEGQSDKSAFIFLKAALAVAQGSKVQKKKSLIELRQRIESIRPRRPSSQAKEVFEEELSAVASYEKLTRDPSAERNLR